MKKFFKYTLSVLALCLFAACSKESTTSSDYIEPKKETESARSLIAFNGEGEAMRGSFMRGVGFSNLTKVVMRIKAEDKSAANPASTARYTKAEATATANIPASGEGADEHSALVGAHSDLDYVTGQERFWDDAYGRNSSLTVWAFAVPEKNDASLLPVWSEDGWTAVDAASNPNWFTDSDGENATVTWDVATEQTAASMQNKDLTYSNNISSNGLNGRYTHIYGGSSWSIAMGDGALQWIAQETGSTIGKFDQGHLIFKHALSKIEICLKEGTGFNTSSTTDFEWTKNQEAATQNMTLKNLHTDGTFNISTGTWTAANVHDITLMNETTVTPIAPQTTRVLSAYVIPGANLMETADNVIEFEIDNAQYYVTGTQIANAIRAFYAVGGAHESDAHAAEYRNFSTIEQGKHYIIHLTVGKKAIDRVTAAVVDWEEVNSSDMNALNTYPTFDLEDRGTALVNGDENEFKIYRTGKTASNYILDASDKDYTWATGYTTDGAASKTWDNANHVWKTNWNWPNNLTYYHFRAVGIHNGDATSNPVPVASTNDYFAIHSGKLTGSSYQDYLWGAPFQPITGQLTYSLMTGFDNTQGGAHQISQAIGATESTIKLLLFHVTSQIVVNVTTTEDADQVKLQDGATKTKVELLNFLPDGIVQMGDGKVSTSTLEHGRGDAEMGGGESNSFTFGVVPQELAWSTPTTGTIGMRITTPDGNQYLVNDISTLTATVTANNLKNPYTETGSGTGKYTINRWYPNYKYTYNVRLKKKGIDHITAAVVDWETVTGDGIDVDLEN